MDNGIGPRPGRLAVTDWRSGYGVVNPTGKEVITYSIWERQTYTSGTTTQLTFFTAVTQFPTGNLPLGGQLPNGQAFLCQAIRVAPFPNVTETASAAPAGGNADGALQDVVQLIRESQATVTVGDKTYGQWPGWMLPSGGGPWGSMGNVGSLTAPASSQFQQGGNGVPDPRSVYTFPIPFVIPPQFNFRVRLDFSAALTLTGGDTDIFVILDGELMRPQQ